MSPLTARFASVLECQKWDDFVVSAPWGGNMLQSAAFAAVKASSGWTPRYIVLEQGQSRCYTLALERAVPPLGKFWYFTKGPEMNSVEELQGLRSALHRLNRKEKLGLFAVKIEPEFLDSAQTRRCLRQAGFVKAPNIQPNDSTALLDTRGDEAEVFQRLGSRARQAIRRAERAGSSARVVEPTEENYRLMYSLMSGTMAAKSTATLRKYEYFAQLWDEFIRRDQGWLYFVYEEERPIVGAFIVKYGNKGTYKDGGSISRASRYGDSHLLQWTAITDLMKGHHPIVQYDLCGTPPSNRVKDKSHPYYGLGLFKTAFSKTVTDFVGCWDLPLDPLRYSLWEKAGERLARNLFVLRKGGQFY